VTQTETAATTTIDAFLGGRVEAVQPATGHHRSGLEAVLLGAALDPQMAGTIVDLGAGAGIAGLCAAERCPKAEVILAERDPTLAECARMALTLPANRGLAGRVKVAEIDITAPEADRIAAGLPREGAVAVVTNPPFHVAQSVSASPAAGRAAAHILATGLDAWFRAAAWTLEPGGVAYAVTKAAALPDLLAGLAGRFGAAKLLPLHPRPGAGAEFLLASAIKGRKGSPAVLPGLTLHEADGNGFSAPLEAILRDGAGLAEVHPPWKSGVPVPS
jgi:tRNA1(Val) A37 N6-methylase TrmN6